MRTWLKLIGSADNPIKDTHTNDQIGFRKDKKPGIRNGDQLFLYAPGGSKRIFALAEAISDPQRKKLGDCQWMLKIRYIVNLPVALGTLINEISSDRNLINSIQRASHIELNPKEYQSAYSKLVQNQIPVCADSPQVARQPERAATTVSRILRDSALVANLKRKYNFKCQICNTRLELRKGYFYCEAHHVRPLGKPHNGSDEESNLVIVCPNHHVLLDYGAIPLSKRSFTSSLHKINEGNINYHNKTIYK